MEVTLLSFFNVPC